MAEPRAITIGVDVGKKADSTAICVAAHMLRAALPAFVSEPGRSDEVYHAAVAMRERGELPMSGPAETVFEARTLQRLPLGISYPDMAATIAYAVRGVASRTPLVPRMYVDATGVGTAFLDILRELRPPCQIVPVYFTHGDRLVWRREGEPPRMNSRQPRDLRPWALSLGKAWLVTRLQALFEGRRVRLSPTNSDAAAMRQELLDYEIRMSDVSNETYGAFKTGAHDDLVTALGLATLTEQQPAGERSERRGVPILPEVF